MCVAPDLHLASLSRINESAATGDNVVKLVCATAVWRIASFASSRFVLTAFTNRTPLWSARPTP
jgi:hypothetical protein